MNRIKRTCALLLAVVLTLGVAFQPAIGGVFAEHRDTEEQSMDATLGPEIEIKPDVETEPMDETEPIIETDPVVETETGAESETEPAVLSFYERLMSCENLADFETLLFAEENAPALEELTQAELKELLAHLEEIFTSLAEPTEEEMLLLERVLKKLSEYVTDFCTECGGENGVHNEGCSLYVPEVEVCPECGGENGVHSENCSLYTPEVEVCPECGGENGEHNEGCSLYVPEVEVCPECDGENGVHSEDCPNYVPVAEVCPECGMENGEHSIECPNYVYTTEVCLECGGENGEHNEGCSLCAPEVEVCPECGGENGVHSEDCPSYVPVAEVCPECGMENGEHSIECPNYVYITEICPECGGENGVHTEECPSYVPVAEVCPECGMENGEHSIECPNYVYITEICPECGGENGAHTEDCPNYIPVVEVCPECGEADGHAVTCSHYTEDKSYPWTEMTDDELAAWLTDEANADYIKTVLSGEGEEYDSLNARIDAIADGDNVELAEQIAGYLAVLLAVDGTEVQADPETGYIYFDLAAGNVEIGKSGYSGYIYIEGVATAVTGTHDDNNKYYIYQTSAGKEKETGYITKDKTNFCIPEYSRVEYDGEPWTDYITNNTKVKEVSINWDTAAANSSRTDTKNWIKFKPESGYTADVTIDNIWSTYRDSKNEDRDSGGIGANLGYNRGTTINLRLKGDNRVACVHYYAIMGTNNNIVFFDGEDSGTTSGSITAADFEKNDLGWKGNHWCAAIGGNDNGYDRSDGIVIESGYIYAGTTPEDNCTAIGGGGNEYGRVIINGGTVTAVVSSTGTAIGGGIGYNDHGGNTDVIINDGTIYAYNLGIQKNLGDSFNKFVPASAIGGGGSNNSAGGLIANITITGGTIYAQSMGGAAIGGGSSANGNGGPANITITGGTIIAKSIDGYFGTQYIQPGVSIGGGTGLELGGHVTLNISEKDDKTILRTGSIGGGNAITEGKPVGYAKVTVSGGDIVGQVVMAAGSNDHCEFTMTGGTIHYTNVINGHSIDDINSFMPDDKIVTDANKDAPINYIRNNGGAVFMNDTQGIATITGGTIENCTANTGGAVYMEGGKFILSGTGKLDLNHAIKSVDKNDNVVGGHGGSVYVGNGTVQIGGAVTVGDNTITEGSPEASACSISKNDAVLDGGGVYVKEGTVTVNGGSIRENKAGQDGGGMYVGQGNVILLGHMDEKATVDDEGYFTISDSSVKLNHATLNGGGMYVSEGNIKISGGEINYNNSQNGGGMYVGNGTVEMEKGSIHDNTASQSGGGVYVSSEADNVTTGIVTVKSGSIKFNKSENGGGLFVDNGIITIEDGEISHNKVEQFGGGMYMQEGKIYMYGGTVEYNEAEKDGGGLYLTSNVGADSANQPLVDILSGSISHNNAANGGGIAVESGNTAVKVIVGVNTDHKLKDDGSFDAFPYPNDCGVAHNGHVHSTYIHYSCPIVMDNNAQEKGGGFYLSSPNSQITIYCLEANDNNAEGGNGDGDFMEVKGAHLQIGDEEHDIHLNSHIHKDHVVKGNTSIHGSIMVIGGMVDVYGEIENPKFADDVKVNIENKKDYYMDHRCKKSGVDEYKVHYYENFKGDGDTPTGLYIARQYPDEEHEHLPTEDMTRYNFTIMSSMFVHPGYRIVGWDLDSDGTGNDFEVNGTYNLKELEGKEGYFDSNPYEGEADKHGDKYLLVIYAIWERNGYILEFDPNVGEGETYSGEMKKQPVTVGLLDGSQKINKNKFKRPGYTFTGWTLNPVKTDGDTVYVDEHVITEDFTEEDGATIILYAQWDTCPHTPYLVYSAKGEVMTEECSNCGGHTATATIAAVDHGYDGEVHLAEVSFTENWLGDKHNLSYDMAADAKWDDLDDIDNNWTNNSQPLHAGAYTANLKYVNKADDGTDVEVVAKAEYNIIPIKWPTPEPPEIMFKVEITDNNVANIIEITSPVNDDTGNKYNYLIKLCKDDTGELVEVEKYPDWRAEKDFSDIDTGYYYYFYAKQCEDRDHIESDSSRSDAYLADGNNLVIIKNATGIKVVPHTGGGSFDYTVSAEKGYHFRNYKDNSDTAVKEAKAIPGAEEIAHNDNDEGITLDKVEESDNKTYKYSVKFDSNKVAYYQITLIFEGAVKNADITYKVTDGQKFRNFNDKLTSISRDSAFTAQFTVSDYYPDEYSKHELKFDKALPAGTTIIMRVDGGGYWYYKVGEDNTNINLTKFTKMGGSEPFTPNTAGEKKTVIYQFIVDFSNAESYIDVGNLGVSMVLTADSTKNAPTIKPDENTSHITVGLKPVAEFTLSATSNGKTATLICAYSPSEGAASIWNGRRTSLVLTAKPTSAVPADLTLTAVADGKTTLYSMSEGNKFYIPVGDIASKKEVKITLNSCMFGSTATNLDFTAEWYVSESKADKSPMNGYLDPQAKCSVTFSCKKDSLPSVRIDDGERLLHAGEVLTIKVNYAGIPTGGKVEAYLQSKNGGQYNDTGLRKDISLEESTPQNLDFNMGEMVKGSYRILVVVKNGGANILQVPYYFVIQ